MKLGGCSRKQKFSFSHFALYEIGRVFYEANVFFFSLVLLWKREGILWSKHLVLSHLALFENRRVFYETNVFFLRVGTFWNFNKQCFTLYCCLSGPKFSPLFPWPPNIMCCNFVIPFTFPGTSEREESKEEQQFTHPDCGDSNCPWEL